MPWAGGAGLAPPAGSEGILENAGCGGIREEAYGPWESQFIAGEIRFHGSLQEIP